MAHTTYGFQGISFVMNHPGVGELVLNGTGVGEVTISSAGDRTSHQVAADGHVMVSKMASPNGTITITVNQVSPANAYLKKWINYVVNGDLDQWTAMVIVIRDSINGATTTLKGVSPQTDADETYQIEGQQVSWTLMAAEVTRQ